uniref:Regulatory protein E2 n=1 Tax=Bos taurus papillomavirus 8 TaxID=2758968 RepID=A0A3G6V9E0_9PAPI|nr:E2 [Bos taurus papillomavirus 8]
MAALERLNAAQETQMTLIENPSTKIEDHISYYGAVRTEQTLYCAARRKHISRLGICPVPTLATATANARAAIEMQLVLKDLLQSPFAKDSWSLVDFSHERYKAPPTDTLKKHPRIVEVMFDGDPQNKTWHTLWGEIYMRTADGWTVTTSSADAKGIFCVMQGLREYYQLFAPDAERFGTRGTWDVFDQNRRFHFPPSSSSDRVDGVPDGPEPRGGDRPTSTPVAAEPDSPSRCVSRDLGRRGSGGPRCRWGTRVHPYVVPGGGGLLVSSCASSPLQSRVSPGAERHQEGGPRPPSPDSTEEARRQAPVAAAGPPAGQFDLLQGTGCSPCVLIEGNGNKVKCLRYRLKRGHRHRFGHITTTFWATGDEGSDRQGNGTILVTFESTSQRKLFLDHVSIPGELTVRSVTISQD